MVNVPEGKNSRRTNVLLFPLAAAGPENRQTVLAEEQPLIIYTCLDIKAATDKKMVNVETYCAQRKIKFGDVLFAINNAEMRPADIGELEALSNQCPDGKIESPVFALGTLIISHDGAFFVSCLFDHDGERRLVLVEIQKGTEFPKNYQFAVVRL